MTSFRGTEVRLPVVTKDTALADVMHPLRELWYDDRLRLGAIEATLGMTPRLEKSGFVTSPLTTKGDIWTYGTTNDRLAVGSNNQLLVPDSAQATGLKWTTTLPAAAFPALTGDVTTSAGSLSATLVNIPTQTPAAGNVQFALISAPSSVASKVVIWADSTSKTLRAIDDTNQTSTMVIADTGAGNNFLTAISAAGVISKAQPTVANLADSAWSTYTPTVTSGSGSFTSVSGAGRYKQIGKTVFAECLVTITTNGTAAISITITLPVTAYSGTYALVKGWNLSTNDVLFGRVYDTTHAYFLKYDGTYSGGDGQSLIVSLTYEAA